MSLILPLDLVLEILRYVDTDKASETSRALGFEDAYWKMLTADYCLNKTTKQVYYMLSWRAAPTTSLPDNQSCSKQETIKQDKDISSYTSFTEEDLFLASTYGSVNAIRHIVSCCPRLLNDFSCWQAINKWNTIGNLETVELLIDLLVIKMHEVTFAIGKQLPFSTLKRMINKWIFSKETMSSSEMKFDLGHFMNSAFLADRLDVVEFLISKGADLSCYVDGNSYMMSARSVETIKFLIEKGLDIDEKCSDGYTTPLMEAIMARSEKGVAGFIQYGANLNVQDAKGYTPLMLACSRGYVPIIEMLLKQKDKMDLSLATTFGDTIHAWKGGYPKLFQAYGL